MTKEDLLKNIAEAGYNVGFGAKKHFATYDITAKVPSLIGFVSTAVGVFALFIDWLSTKDLSAAFIVLGVMGICIGIYDQKKDSYAEAGRDLTKIFNRLKTLYFDVKAAKEADLPKFEQELKEIETDYSKTGISDQILLSGWYAHYKFFWEHQIDWIDEQKKFRFFRDKVPLSLTATVALLLVCMVGVIVRHYFWK